MYKVWVNGFEVTTIEQGFEFGQGELLWQALSEQARELGINGISDTEENLAEWQSLDDDNIKALLEDAERKGFIENFEMEMF